ncbi:MAG: ATP-binding protein [Flavobacteriales bacterium]|nr:ATP-binding protein [Flavobacteriales bacterium]MDG1781456.1 ATP-binding protein [Flavobacteriales bacterium]MDG2247379.1 ATP-binding protein [Flavobacteriales bacterium]
MSYVLEMIAEGEHQRQDFKMRIEDSRKIAKTLVAFANTDGGRLLIGVKDNGSVSGVNAEEEYHMIEAAAEMYCKPAISFSTQVWKSNFKAVLEVIVEPSLKGPHFAQDDEKEWHAYQRREDRNIRANGVLLKVWQHKAQDMNDDFEYTRPVHKLFKALRNNNSIGFKKVSRIVRMNRLRTEELLAKLVVWEVIDMQFNDSGCHFVLLDEGKAALKENDAEGIQ